MESRSRAHGMANGRGTADHYGDAPSLRVCVDVVAFSVRNESLQVLLVERPGIPETNQAAIARWQFPTADLRVDSADIGVVAADLVALTAQAGRRRIHLQQIQTYQAHDCCGQQPTDSIVYLSLLWLPTDTPPRPGTSWHPAGRILRPRQTVVATGTTKIIRDALDRLRTRLEYTTDATWLCPTEFTIPELIRVYELVWQCEIDERNFRRRALGTEGFLLDTHHRRAAVGLAAVLYRRGNVAQIHAPLVQPNLSSRN